MNSLAKCEPVFPHRDIHILNTLFDGIPVSDETVRRWAHADPNLLCEAAIHIIAADANPRAFTGNPEDFRRHRGEAEIKALTNMPKEAAEALLGSWGPFEWEDAFSCTESS